jgi:protein-S-isoprenylcysteine O-methyltransferase Ste14
VTPALSVAIWVACLVAWVVIRLPYQRRARRIGVSRDARTLPDRLALGAATVGLAVVPGLHVATGVFRFADYPFQPWLAWIGVFVAAAFLALFTASHRALGKNWSVSLEIRREHTLVTDGLYRYVRHPMYSSFWLWALAQACLVQNGIAGLSGLVGVALLYWTRVGPEERMMREAFNGAYDAYARRTGRVVPKVW